MKVMAIAPYEGLKELMSRLAQYEEFELQVELGDLKKGVRLAKEAINNGTDIIISRGGTAELIQKEISNPVIEVEVSGYDMLSVLTLAKDYPGKKAIVGFSQILEGASTISNILDIDISPYKVTFEEEVEPLLANLQKDGYQTIVGDVITVKKAEKLGLNGILLTSGKESVTRAFHNAKKLHELFTSIKNNYLLSHTIVQEENKGISVYDQNMQSIFSNPYFNNQIGREVFEENIDIRFAVSEVFHHKMFKTIFHDKNSIWEVSGSPLQNNDGPFVVFRIKKSISLEKQGIQGISILTSKSSLSQVKISTKNKVMEKTLRLAENYRDKQLPVWITGEKGTGKENLVYYMHFNSVNRLFPLLVLDCDVISESQWYHLLQSDQINSLMSYNKQGTIFFKNIDALNLSMQKKLTHYLKEGSINSQIIASSNKDIQTMINKGVVFHDLYYFIAQATLYLPDLNERKEDIESLSLLFINNLNTKFGKQIVGIRNDAKNELENFKWTGNIDQLKQVIEECVFLTDGPFLEKKDVKEVLDSKHSLMEEGQIDLTGTLEKIEKEIIKKVWLQEGKNNTRTAERLGINRTTLWRKLKG